MRDRPSGLLANRAQAGRRDEKGARAWGRASGDPAIWRSPCRQLAQRHRSLHRTRRGGCCGGPCSRSVSFAAGASSLCTWNRVWARSRRFRYLLRERSCGLRLPSRQLRHPEGRLHRRVLPESVSSWSAGCLTAGSRRSTRRFRRSQPGRLCFGLTVGTYGRGTWSSGATYTWRQHEFGYRARSCGRLCGLAAGLLIVGRGVRHWPLASLACGIALASSAKLGSVKFGSAAVGAVALPGLALTQATYVAGFLRGFVGQQ